MNSNFAVIGIDGGGTKSRGIAAAADGSAIASRESGSTNPDAVGRDTAKATLQRLIEKLSSDARAAGREVAAICCGLAGCDRPQDEAFFLALVQSLAPDGSVQVVNDSLIALAAGAPEGFGVVLIAGTGSNAFGLAPDGRLAHVGGWGHILGDEGSGYAIGHHALRAVCRAHDGRGPKTALTNLVLEFLNLPAADDLLPWIRAAESFKAAAASVAPIALKAWAAGDPVATRIVEQAVADQVEAADAVFRRLDWAAAPAAGSIPCVLAGGLAKNERFFTAFRKALAERLPALEARRLKRRAVEGAVDMALRLLAKSA